MSHFLGSLGCNLFRPKRGQQNSLREDFGFALSPILSSPGQNKRHTPRRSKCLIFDANVGFYFEPELGFKTLFNLSNMKHMRPLVVGLMFGSTCGSLLGAIQCWPQRIMSTCLTWRHASPPPQQLEFPLVPPLMVPYIVQYVGTSPPICYCLVALSSTRHHIAHVSQWPSVVLAI